MGTTESTAELQRRGETEGTAMAMDMCMWGSQPICSPKVSALWHRAHITRQCADIPQSTQGQAPCAQCVKHAPAHVSSPHTARCLWLKKERAASA
eukprot:143868-Amphidinium_carterae.1